MAHRTSGEWINLASAPTRGSLRNLERVVNLDAVGTHCGLKSMECGLALAKSLSFGLHTLNDLQPMPPIAINDPSRDGVDRCTTLAVRLPHLRCKARSTLNGPAPAADRYRNTKQKSTAVSP